MLRSIDPQARKGPASFPFKTVSDIEYATAGWVDWYNHRRLHSRLGHTTPVEFEHAHYTALLTRASPDRQRHESQTLQPDLLPTSP